MPNVLYIIARQGQGRGRGDPSRRVRGRIFLSLDTIGKQIGLLYYLHNTVQIGRCFQCKKGRMLLVTLICVKFGMYKQIGIERYGINVLSERSVMYLLDLG